MKLVCRHEAWRALICGIVARDDYIFWDQQVTQQVGCNSNARAPCSRVAEHTYTTESHANLGVGYWQEILSSSTHHQGYIIIQW